MAPPLSRSRSLLICSIASALETFGGLVCFHLESWCGGEGLMLGSWWLVIVWRVFGGLWNSWLFVHEVYGALVSREILRLPAELDDSLHFFFYVGFRDCACILLYIAHHSPHHNPHHRWNLGRYPNHYMAISFPYRSNQWALGQLQHG